MYSQKTTLASNFVPNSRFTSMIKSLDDRIREGGHRIVYSNGNVVVKVLKSPVRAKLGPIHLNVPASIYARYRTGRRDFNVAEYENYRRMVTQVPRHLRDSFMEVYGLEQAQEGYRSICELVTDFDGSISKSLKEAGQIQNTAFWNRIAELEEHFIGTAIPFFDIKDDNVLVRRVSPDLEVPVIVDYDLIGYHPFAVFLNLVSLSRTEQKIRDRFAAIRQKYQPNTPSETSQAHLPHQNP